ncbi:adenylyl cyclase [Kineosporiaceae bacterium B12]|nr:adenylyl cyclase [Kineococcus rubinsiae]
MSRPAAARRGASLLSAVVLAGALTSVAAAPALGAADAGRPPVRPAAAPDLGPNTIVFDPSMTTAQIQARVDAIAAQQVGNQFGRERYALLFKPGTYGTPAEPLRFQVGYYTEVAGLGRDPGDVTINGSIDVYNQCETTPEGEQSCTALNNFWRSLSNLRIALPPKGNPEFWAASQAAPMRRVDLTGGDVFLFDYNSQPSYASGGFIADSAFSGGSVINGGQQQYYTRNSSLDGWSNGVWNQVFSGDVGAVPPQSFGVPGVPGPYTTLATTPVSKEKPYLYVDGAGAWNLFVPSARTNTKGTSWQGGHTPGRSVPMRDVFVARPSNSVARINAALAQGKHLLLTPGVYDVATSLAVKRAGTVVLGLGLATLTAQSSAPAMTVADVRGVDIAGVTFDAGPVNSPVLLRVGSKHGKGGEHRGSAADPTALQDVFFRIGGPHVGKADVSLEVNSDHVLLDDLWVWRADHGEGVGWTVNTADTGVVVNGNDVTATGLFVEHFQRYNTVWNGERGRTVFYQNELPYDAPNQAAWRHDGVDGWAAYKVGDRVRTHEAWGLGSYIFTNVDPTLHATNAFEVPVRPGVRLHDLTTISLNKAGTIDHVVNGVGAAVTPEFQGPSIVVDYPTP